MGRRPRLRRHDRRAGRAGRAVGRGGRRDRVAGCRRARRGRHHATPRGLAAGRVRPARARRRRAARRDARGPRRRPARGHARRRRRSTPNSSSRPPRPCDAGCRGPWSSAVGRCSSRSSRSGLGSSWSARSRSRARSFDSPGNSASRPSSSMAGRRSRPRSASPTSISSSSAGRTRSPTTSASGPNDAVAVLTHDVKFDEPAIIEALRRRCRYVGAVGSRKTQADRRARLLEAGVTEEELARPARAGRPGPRRSRPGRDRARDPGRGRRRALRRLRPPDEGARASDRRMTTRAGRPRWSSRPGRVAVRWRQAPGVARGAAGLQHVLDRVAEAGLDDVVVVLGDDAEAVEGAIEWRARAARPEPGSRSGPVELVADRDRGARRRGRWRAHRPRRPAARVARSDPGAARCARRPGQAHRRARLSRRCRAEPGPGRPRGVRARGRGDRRPGLGPVIAAHPELVREVPVDVPGGNPDIDTRADLVTVLETAWAARVRANAEQVDRFREVPDGTDFYAPGHRPVPGRSDADRRSGPGCPPAAGPAGRTLARHRGGRRPLRPADRAGPGAVRRGGRRRSIRRHRCSTGCARSRRSTTSTTSGRSRRAGRRPIRPTSRPMSRSSPMSSYDIEAIGPFVGGDGVGGWAAVRRDAHGAPAVVDRRRVLAAGPRRGAGPAAGPARVRRAAAGARS